MTQKKKIRFKVRFLIALLLGIFVWAGVFINLWINPSGDSATEIEKAEKQIENLFSYGIADFKNWEKVERITDTLIWYNREIARAKVLLKYEKRPAFSSEHIWNNRHVISNRAWKLQGTTSRLLIAFALSSLSFFICLISILLALTIIPWCWYFLLDRIDELSRVIRGN